MADLLKELKENKENNSTRGERPKRVRVSDLDESSNVKLLRDKIAAAKADPDPAARVLQMEGFLNCSRNRINYRGYYQETKYCPNNRSQEKVSVNALSAAIVSITLIASTATAAIMGPIGLAQGFLGAVTGVAGLFMAVMIVGGIEEVLRGGSPKTTEKGLEAIVDGLLFCAFKLGYKITPQEKRDIVAYKRIEKELVAEINSDLAQLTPAAVEASPHADQLHNSFPGLRAKFAENAARIETAREAAINGTDIDPSTIKPIILTPRQIKRAVRAARNR